MIAEQSRLPNGAAKAEIYIERFFESDAAGTIWVDYTGRSWSFYSLTQMIEIYGGILDDIGAAHSAYELRSLRDRDTNAVKGTVMAKGIGKKPEGMEKPTFIVNVLYRQNASWQGTVKWVETGIEKSFRSTLELLKLMDSAMLDDSDTGWGD